MTANEVAPLVRNAKPNDLWASIAEVVNAAVAEEREACAALVEKMGVNLATSAADYARAIRRGPK